jgi:hypothetical protein
MTPTASCRLASGSSTRMHEIARRLDKSSRRGRRAGVGAGRGNSAARDTLETYIRPNYQARSGKEHIRMHLPSRLQTAAALGAAVASILASTSTALADGGQSIASATSVAYSSQEFGNTANGGQSPNECSDTAYRSWWSLSVIAGDDITINWEADSASEDDIGLHVFPVGTTDYNFLNENAVEVQALNENLKNQLQFTATRTGVMPMEFNTGTGCGNPATGPYDFAAYVSHEMILGLPGISQISRHGVVAVGVHDPDGVALSSPTLRVSLQLLSHGRWQTLGAGDVINGVAKVPIQLSTRLDGEHIRLRALATGASYRTAVSRSVTALVR